MDYLEPGNPVNTSYNPDQTTPNHENTPNNPEKNALNPGNTSEDDLTSNGEVASSDLGKI